MARCGAEMDISDLKLARAHARARDIGSKREQYKQARAAPRSRSAAVADRVKPHRVARVATRALVAKGSLEVQADFPAIVSVGRPASAQGGRRKPAVAAALPPSTSLTDESTASEFDADAISDTETTVSEASNQEVTNADEPADGISESPADIASDFKERRCQMSAVPATSAAPCGIATPAKREDDGWEVVASAELRSPYCRGAIWGWSLLS